MEEALLRLFSYCLARDGASFLLRDEASLSGGTRQVCLRLIVGDRQVEQRWGYYHDTVLLERNRGQTMAYQLARMTASVIRRMDREMSASQGCVPTRED